MADFETKKGAGEAMKAGGTALDAYGAYKDAYAAAASEYFNADMLEMQAVDILTLGDVSAAKAQTEGRQVIGAQRAGYAGQGVDVGSGSAFIGQENTAIAAVQDARMVKLDAARKAWALRGQAAQKRDEADQMRSAGRRRAYSTLLSGWGSQMAS